MSHIDDVQKAIGNNESCYLSMDNYVRIMDTPHVWGEPFGKEIMPKAIAREAEFERAVEEIIQKTKYRCDISSLNSPDPDWAKVILGAMDTCLSNKTKLDVKPQFCFLFGQTPMVPVGEPDNYKDFKAALIRLFQERSGYWIVYPEIYLGRFYRFEKGIIDSLIKKFNPSIMGCDAKMTWNHAKIISADGIEALVGGHNLNMDLFRSYPPVHDVSVIVHGDAAYGAQLFLDKMWKCSKDLLTKEMLNVTGNNYKWIDEPDIADSPQNPLNDDDNIEAKNYRSEYSAKLDDTHELRSTSPLPAATEHSTDNHLLNQDLQTLEDLKKNVFEERVLYNSYASLNEYKKATRILTVGKYWSDSTTYQCASEIMKETLIKNAKNIIRMSQMDLISAWKKNWSDHKVCQWIIEALLKNDKLIVQIIVSPLDAGAGAEGDQYSFGSGALRTFEIIEHYMTYDAETGNLLVDSDNKIKNASKRLFVAPLYYTDKVPVNETVEGVSYKWPGLSEEGYTATLKTDIKPCNDIIGSAIHSAINASGVFPKVKSAPGNHAKVMIIDDELYVVGSDNLYPGFLSEINYLIEGEAAVTEFRKSYWNPLWSYSQEHCIKDS